MNKKKIVCIVLMLVLALGKTGSSMYKFNMKYKNAENSTYYTVKIVEKVKTEEYRLVYLAECFGNKFLLNIYKSSYGKSIDLNKYSNYTYGDVLKVKGKLVVPQLLGNPYEFNYKRYLNSKNICGTINTYENIQYLDKEDDLKGYIYILKQYILDLIDKSQQKENAVLTKSYIYGNKTELDQSVKNGYDILGISHMIVASGASISILVLIINKISKLLKINEKAKDIITVIQILIFIALCGFEYSILRAGIVGIISCIFNMCKRKINALSKLAIAIYVIYLLNPMCIFSISFWLSCLAVFSIMFFYSKIEVRVNWVIQNKIPDKIFKYLNLPIKLFYISISVKILTIPITINTFNTISIFSIIPNILIGLIICTIRFAGMLSNILIVIPGLSSLIYTLMEPVIEFTNMLVTNMQKLSICVPVRSFPIYIWIIYYLLILSIILKDRLIIKEYKVSIAFNKIINGVKQYLIYILIITIVFSSLKNIFANNYAMFFNVKQGDMAYIQYMDANILIDAGSESTVLASNVFINFCKKENIQNIDAILISHFHTDHINGIKEICENINIEQIVYSLPKENMEEYFKFKKWVNEKNIKQLIVNRGDKLNVGAIKICILLPDKQTVPDDNIANANSMVCTVKIKDNCFLFMGDATKNTENYLLKQKSLDLIDVLKVGHHGSKTSTSESFIKETNPSIAIISSQKAKYGHPSDETLTTLEKYNIKRYITEQNGAIKIKF